MPTASFDTSASDTCASHGHRRQVGDAQDDRRLLVGVQRLALFRGLRDDGAGHRRVDLGVAEIGLVAAQGRFGLLDLRLERVDLGTRRMQLRLGGLQRIRSSSRPRGRDSVWRWNCCSRKHELRLPIGELRPLVAELRTGRHRPRARYTVGSISASSSPAFTVVADLEIQLLQLAGDLSADIDVFRGCSVPNAVIASSISPRSTVAVGWRLRESAGGPDTQPPPPAPAVRSSARSAKAGCATASAWLCRGRICGARSEERVFTRVATRL